MGKKWFMLFIIALAGILATTAFATKMVIVLDPETGFEHCYKADVAEQETGVTLSNVGNCGELDKGSKDQKIGIKKQGETSGKVHDIVDVSDYTVIFSHSPGCVTYWYHGHSYTVCN
jgi:hypothetical protein